MAVIKTTFLLKRSTLAKWNALNPILEQGEPGFAYDANILKIGDGITPWKDLLPPNGDSSTSQIISVNAYSELPQQGDIKIIYRVIEEKTLYQWNNSKYEILSTGEINIDQITQKEGQVLELYGGSATDNI